MTQDANDRYDVSGDFARALAERGLPADATLAGLLRHERGNAALGAANTTFASVLERLNAIAAEPRKTIAYWSDIPESSPDYLDAQRRISESRRFLAIVERCIEAVMKP